MGAVELLNDPSNLYKAENVDNIDLSDTDLVFTVRRALTSVQTVSVLQLLLLSCAYVFVCIDMFMRLMLCFLILVYFFPNARGSQSFMMSLLEFCTSKNLLMLMLLHSLRCVLFFLHRTINSFLFFSLFAKVFSFSFVWQTVLKALSGSVACIDIVHHKKLLSSVSFYCKSLQLNLF